jgi:hypothetical protein
MSDSRHWTPRARTEPRPELPHDLDAGFREWLDHRTVRGALSYTLPGARERMEWDAHDGRRMRIAQPLRSTARRVARRLFDLLQFADRVTLHYYGPVRGMIVNELARILHSRSPDSIVYVGPDYVGIQRTDIWHVTMSVIT